MRLTWLLVGGSVALLAWYGCSEDSTAAAGPGATSGPNSGTGATATSNGGSTSTQQSAGGSTNGPGAGGSSGVGGTPPCGPDPVPPGSSACPAECTSCTPENVCVIDCTGDGSCDGQDFDCPDEYACEVICNGIDACDGGSLLCPPAQACSLTCLGGNDACGSGFQMQCGDAPCYLDCAADACAEFSMDCGTGYCAATCAGPPLPTVNCGPACECVECM